MSLIKEDLLEWSKETLIGSETAEITEIRELRQEASSRKYYRLKGKQSSFIGVFSPPESEINQQFVFLSSFLRDQGITVPEVYFFDLTKGFMLLEDFGDDLYQFKLNKNNFKHLFSCAINQMIAIQMCSSNKKIPSMGEVEIKMQMLLLEEWFLSKLLKVKINQQEKDSLSNLYNFISHDLAEQPRTLCHFDFESRNLIALKDGGIGVLDFQDAVWGPICLDPAALFKDLYLELTEKEIEDLLEMYIDRSIQLGLNKVNKIEDIKKSFDMACLQRELRILGTLSRLHLRDKKSFRLADLNKTLSFVIQTCKKYEELIEVSEYFQNKIAPVLTKFLKDIL